MEIPAGVPYDVPSIAIIVIAGIAAGIAILSCSHLFRAMVGAAAESPR
jgi:hypothetical protein